MEQNATQVEFSSRWHAALWLGCELPKFAGLGMLIGEVQDFSNINLVTILLITVSVMVQVLISPDRPPGTLRTISMAASNRLGLNGSLIWKVQAAIYVACLVGFVAAVTVSFSR
jgi:hypothetical protein